MILLSDHFILAGDQIFGKDRILLSEVGTNFLKETGFFYHIFLQNQIIGRDMLLLSDIFYTCWKPNLWKKQDSFIRSLSRHLKRTKLLEEKEFFLPELFYTCREPYVWKRQDSFIRYLYLQGTKRFRKRQGSFIRYFYTYRDPIGW